jgi:Holliday junction resolvase RusA-like endonuclease
VSVYLRVRGIPAPQGSKIRTRYGMREASLLVEPWREAIVSEVMREGLQDRRMSGPLVLRATFFHKRLAAHYGTRKGEKYLREGAPVYVATTPDIDKVQRSTFDGLTQSGLIADDKFIVVVHLQQKYSDTGFTGAEIEIGAVDG